MKTTHTYHIQTFGCQMNVSDSDWIARSLRGMGFTEAKAEEASVCILNTCTVRDKPEKKVYSELGRIIHSCKTKDKPVPLLCVGGCVAQQLGTSLRQRFPEVRLIFGTDGISRVPQSIQSLLQDPRSCINLLEFYDSYQEKDALWAEEPIKPLSAFVTIMQGCDNFCTYCIVPYVRGRQKSRHSHDIIQECISLAEQGCKELTLLGQNVNAFGKDNGSDGLSFTDLLAKISEIECIQRINFLTSHPKDMDKSLIRLFAENKKLCSRLHLPLQSGSDTVLKRMKRRYTMTEYLDLVSQIRSARPDMLFSTDLIVGFPGETEKEFFETIEAMKTVQYFNSFSFIYSDRPKTKAQLFPDKIERKEALQRLSLLQETQNQLTEQMLHSMIGQKVLVLLESVEEHFPKHSPQTQVSLKEQWVGSSNQGIKVFLDKPTKELRRGDMVFAKVYGVTKQSLLVQYVEA